TPTAGAQAQTHTTGLSSPLPAYDHQSQDHTTISLLRDRLALLEVWVTELKEQPPSYTTSSPDTELLQDQINQEKLQPLTTPNTPTDPPSPTTTAHTDHSLPTPPVNKEAHIGTPTTERSSLAPHDTPPHTPPCTQALCTPAPAPAPAPHRKSTTLVKPTEVAILIDSNGKLIQEDKLFPHY
ncbi:unnamed protein product, partial [Coregonus sp. 'balchen']